MDHCFPFRHTPTPAGVPQTDGQENSSLYEIQDSGVHGTDHLSQLTNYKVLLGGFNYSAVNMT